MSQDITNKIRVGVLRGGVDSCYKKSLTEGGNVIAHILENLSDKYKPVDILIDTNGIWHVNGVPIEPEGIAGKVDVIWNTLHPNLSKVFKDLSIPIVGVNYLNFLSPDNRVMLEKHMKEINVKMPRHLILPLYKEDIDGTKEKYATQKAKDVFEKFSSPWIVRPLVSDVSMGVHIANTFPELVNAIMDGIKHNHGIVVEELIIGKFASVHTLAGFRNKDIYSFPIIEKFSSLEKEKLIFIAQKIYEHIDTNDYLKTDLILHPTKGIYLSDISSYPSLSEDSHLNQSCESVGAKTHHALASILEASFSE